MSKYRKKPVVIQAIQYDGRVEPIRGWLKEIGIGVLGLTGLTGYGPVTIRTLEGEMTVSKGDYIICGVQKELYPCKPDIFKATYEFIGDDDE